MIKYVPLSVIRPLMRPWALAVQRAGAHAPLPLCIGRETRSRDTGRPMSQENIEPVRRFYDAFVRGDLEAALGAFDPEIEAYNHDIPDAGDYRGFKGCLRLPGRLGAQVGDARVV